MEDLLKQLIISSPSAVAVIVVVRMYIVEMRSERTVVLEFFKELHKEHISQRELSRTAIERMVAITERNISATNLNSHSLAELSNTLRGHTPPQAI